MYRKILVPTDGSSLSQQAAAVAIEFARVHGAELVVLSVAQPNPVMLADGAMVGESASDHRILLDLAQENVDQVVQRARAAGVKCLGTVALSFLPHEEIIRVAAAHGCDVVFMASHGRRGLSRLLAGSVTQNVLAYSDIPVLVLRPGAPP
jgi:nucleotide-binding universal stress UspA family protein